MTCILLIYGLFCVIFRPFFSFDKTYLNQVSEEINEVFPDEYLLITQKISIRYETSVKFTNEEEVTKFESYLNTSSNQDETSNLPNNIDISILITAKSSDYFLIYDFDSLDSNYFTDRGIDKVVLLYNLKDDVLTIYEIPLILEDELA